MIVGKLWRALRAQLNKLANFFWSKDPVAQMQYEYDAAVEQLRDGRTGLEQYRALVERVTRQANNDKQHVASLESKIKAFLQMGNREMAAKFAIELQKAQKSLAENQAQLQMHEQSYNNNLTKIQHATSKLASLKDKIHKYDADLKMSRAEAEVAKLAESFNFNVTTDFGQVEQVVQDQISLNRAKARVAADLSNEGLAEIQADQMLERAQAEDALKQFEREMGLVTPDQMGLGQPEQVKQVVPAAPAAQQQVKP
jgi:phage shock protein A